MAFLKLTDLGAKSGKGGFFKSGLIILGGFYGYKYFTGDLEDIN
jgi:hypothetical protein